MQAAMNEEAEHEDIFEMEQNEKSKNAVPYDEVELSLSPFALFNLWLMTILISGTCVALVVRCVKKMTPNEQVEWHGGGQPEENVDF